MLFIINEYYLIFRYLIEHTFLEIGTRHRSTATLFKNKLTAKSVLRSTRHIQTTLRNSGEMAH